MPAECFNPDSLPPIEGYHQVAVASGTRLVFVSGQIARSASGELIGREDLAAQSEQVYRNLHAAVVAAGGSFSDFAKLTIFVVDFEPSKMEPIVAGATRAATDLGFDPQRPVTLLGVTALGEPDLLIEVEGTAVLA